MSIKFAIKWLAAAGCAAMLAVGLIRPAAQATEAQLQATPCVGTVPCRTPTRLPGTQPPASNTPQPPDNTPAPVATLPSGATFTPAPPNTSAPTTAPPVATATVVETPATASPTAESATTPTATTAPTIDRGTAAPPNNIAATAAPSAPVAPMVVTAAAMPIVNAGSDGGASTAILIGVSALLVAMGGWLLFGRRRSTKS